MVQEHNVLLLDNVLVCKVVHLVSVLVEHTMVHEGMVVVLALHVSALGIAVVLTEDLDINIVRSNRVPIDQRD